MFVYHFIWTLAYVFAAPLALVLRNKRLMGRLALDLTPRSLGNGNIWIHALSVGEVISAIPLIDAVHQKYPEKDIILTVTTEKGMALARESLEKKVKALLLMPVDAWVCIHRLVRTICPCVFVLVETDIWPALTAYLKKKGIKTVLVNGRVSPRTFKAYMRAPFIVRKMFSSIERCLMQSDLDRKRLLATGIPPERVVTTGNIKFDREWLTLNAEECERWVSALGLKKDDALWIAGSTHPEEEDIVLQAHQRLLTKMPGLRLIIAPRRIEESSRILKLAKTMGFETVLRSEVGDTDEKPWDVLILDSIGELGRIYGLGQVSFVGGSLVPFGGHNLLEPAAFGQPVIFGPHTHNFVQMSEMLLTAGGGMRVTDEASLFGAIGSLLENPEKRRHMGDHARIFVSENRGALLRVADCIQELTTLSKRNG